LQAKYLESGFADLAVKQNPRKRAELLRYIETMDIDTVSGGRLTHFSCAAAASLQSSHIPQLSRRAGIGKPIATCAGKW